MKFAPAMMKPAPTQLLLARLQGEPEIFYSVQGEGKSIGIPAVFVRTSLCNLHCFWCDTDYTWNWAHTRFEHANDARPEYRKFVKKDWIDACSIEDVADRIRAFDRPHVILTGGEPMLQQPALLNLMNRLREDWKRAVFFEIETNGVIRPDATFDAAIDQYNVSPKLENSRNPRKLREKPAVYRFFAGSPKAFFKFVVAEKSDLDEVLDLINRYRIAPEKVWLMPEGNTREALAARREWLVEVCKTYGFRFSDRLHVQIWGEKKGV